MNFPAPVCPVCRRTLYASITGLPIVDSCPICHRTPETSEQEQLIAAYITQADRLLAMSTKKGAKS